MAHDKLSTWPIVCEVSAQTHMLALSPHFKFRTLALVWDWKCLTKGDNSTSCAPPKNVHKRLQFGGSQRMRNAINCINTINLSFFSLIDPIPKLAPRILFPQLTDTNIYEINVTCIWSINKHNRLLKVNTTSAPAANG